MFCQCDKCGNRIQLNGVKSPASRQWKQVGKPFETSIDAPWLDNQAASVQPDYDEYERRQPARAASVEADVAVPAFQSLLWGAASLPLTIPLTLVTGWPWWAAPAMSCAVVSVSWASSMARHSQLLWLIEHVVKRDVDGDGQTGKPQPPPAIPLEVTHPTEAGKTRQLFELPQGVSEGMFNTFVEGILNGKSTAEGGWTGRGKLFSKGQYTDIRDILILSGLARWKDINAKAQGWELTKPAGARTLAAYLSPPPPVYDTRN